MIRINLYKSRNRLPSPVKGHCIRFEGLGIPKKSARRALFQSIVTRLNKLGVECAVAPNDLLDSFHIVILGLDDKKVEDVVSRYSNLAPRIVKVESVRSDIIGRSWQNKIRTYLLRRGFLKTGDRYVLEKDVIESSNIYKNAFRIQAIITNGYPSLFIDPCTRIMIPLKKESIDLGDSLGEESNIRVRTLPNWSGGILIGRSGRKAIERAYKIGNRMYKTPEYWKIKNDIHFVEPDDEMLDIFLSSSETTWEYPGSCVFSEYKRGISLPGYLKKRPETRVKLSQEFIKAHLGSLKFLSQLVSLAGPSTVSEIGYKGFEFPSEYRFEVIVGGHNITNIKKLHHALREHGPYTGKIDGKYVVIHPGDKTIISKAFGSMERAYTGLNLGELTPLTGIGDDGFIYTGGGFVSDYTSAIAELRSELEVTGQKVLAAVVLPDVHSSEVYYRSRDTLFERIFGAEPVPTQAISYEVLNGVAKDERKGYPICVNTASQMYIKLGGTGAAVWILREAADTPISGVKPGSTCYAYHDVSRRPKKKASATAYSALTDSYGRYIATGTKPIGGERLTPSGFYDILVRILQKVSMFSQRYAEVNGEKRFKLQRLVFAKDGVIRNDESDMMEEVILRGIPDERKRPIPKLLKKMPIFPNSLVLDIIGVNKSPNKRIFWQGPKEYTNVREGTAVAYNQDEGLLVSCSSLIGTARPIEISFKRHICINLDIPKPSISQILEEYYRLTFLNWASVFKQGKFALPQILTQNLGENISAGVLVPDDMILL